MVQIEHSGAVEQFCSFYCDNIEEWFEMVTEVRSILSAMDETTYFKALKRMNECLVQFWTM